MSIDVDWCSVLASPPVPQYSHTAVMIGSTILLVVIAVIAGVTLLIPWGRRGRRPGQLMPRRPAAQGDR